MKVKLLTYGQMQQQWWEASVREEKVPRKKIEGNLEVKFPTVWTHGKAEVGRVREEKESEEKESVIRCN